MSSRPGVVIADRSKETREVLRMALTDRAEVWETTRAATALELARRHRPDVIVLDCELAQEADAAVRQALGDPRALSVPVVLLGRARRAQQEFPAGQFVAKPYDYAQLIFKIERLLDEAQHLADRGASET